MNKPYIILFSWLLLLSVSPIAGQHAQTAGYKSNASSFELFVPSTQINAQTQEIQQEILQFCESLDRRKQRYKNPVSFWKHAYYKVHRKFLKSYQSPATLSDVFKEGTYDCLSGTALYALIFDQLGANYRIIETNYHIYLELLVDGETILIESTNPLGGFITDEIVVKDLQENYQENSGSDSWENKDYYRSQSVLNQSIGLKELAGLQYFNLAVEAYNNRDLVGALALQDRALNLYPSLRLEEMMAVMLKTMESDPSFDLVLKQQYLSKYDHLRHIVIVAYQK